MNFVGNLSLFATAKSFINQSRIDKVIAMVRMAQFFYLQCIVESETAIPPDPWPTDH